MAIRRDDVPQSEHSPRRLRKPETTPQGRESKLISMAEKLAEKQLRDGTASSQVITHFLKLGSTREEKEQAKIEGEIALQEARIRSLGTTERLETLQAEALRAFQGYQGRRPETENDSS